jgi:hypothetical protein
MIASMSFAELQAVTGARLIDATHS